MKLTILNVACPFVPVGPESAGSAEQVLALLDQALVSAGHRSIVVACAQSQTAGALLASAQCYEALSSDLSRYVRAEHRRTIEEALERWPVDVIHMHGADFHLYLPRSNRPILVTLHLPLEDYAEDILRSLPANVRLHCVSEAQARQCPEGLRVRPVIENGIFGDGARPMHSRRNFAAAFGRIAPEKGLHIAVAAAKRAEAPLFLAGEVVADHASYWRHVLLPQLDQKRRWIGAADKRRVRRVMAGAKCVLIPSLFAEASSLIAMEALACGTPVIAFPSGALCDIVEHGKTGFLVRDEIEMADAIHAATSINPDVCRESVRQRYPAVRTLARYLGLYQQLANEHQSVYFEHSCVA